MFHQALRLLRPPAATMRRLHSPALGQSARLVASRTTTSRGPLSVLSLQSTVLRSAALAPTRSFSSKAPAHEGVMDFYQVLGLQKGVDKETLKSVYKQIARDNHPDRFQGAEREVAEVKFQAISEAYTVLSDDILRQMYDQQLDAATTKAAREAAVKKVRAESWNTEVPDLQVCASIFEFARAVSAVGSLASRCARATPLPLSQARLRAKPREEPQMNRHILAACLGFVTLNFVLCFNWLAG